VAAIAYELSWSLMSPSAGSPAGPQLLLAALSKEDLRSYCPAKEQFRFSFSHHVSPPDKQARRWGSAKMFGEETRCEEVRYSWKMPDGTSCRMTLFDVTASEAEDVAKACGWPGTGLLPAGHARRGSATASTLSI
jgi:hypothetical protein